MGRTASGASRLPEVRLDEQGRLTKTEDEITLIQCTDSKREEVSLARDLYDKSRYFRRMRSWAQAREQVYGTRWAILSGKHGLVWPDDTLAPYNAVGISESQARDIAAELSALGTTTVHITAGRKYTDTLIPALEAKGIDVINHFAGENIGVREQKLQAETDKLTHRTP